MVIIQVAKQLQARWPATERAVHSQEAVDCSKSKQTKVRKEPERSFWFKPLGRLLGPYD